MVGPCLCGDPYCPHCGDPSRMAVEEAEQDLMETLYELKLSAVEYKMIKQIALAIIPGHRKDVADQVEDARMDDGQYIDYLEEKLNRYEQERSGKEADSGAPRELEPRQVLRGRAQGDVPEGDEQ